MPGKGYRLPVVVILAAVVVLSIAGRAPARQYPDCLQCHIHKKKAEGKYVHPIYKQGCHSCHTNAHLQESPFPKFLFNKGVDLCWACHEKAKFSRTVGHPPVAKGECLSCHDVHTSDTAKLLLAPMPDLCFMCHDKETFVNHTSHPPVADGKCTSCHDPHSSDAKRLLLAEMPRLCFTCHNEERYISPTKKRHHPPVLNGKCMSCHEPHASSARRLLITAIPDLCFTCHEAAYFKDTYTHAPTASGMCTSCHEPHESDTRKLTIAQGADLCFTCHDKADFIKPGLHPPVAAGMCSVCHDPHAAPNIFQLRLPISEGCLQCHPRIAKAPHVLGGFTEAGHPLSGRKHEKSSSGELTCASCHTPHSSDYMKLFRYPAEKPMDLCKNCHEHPSGG